MRNKLKTIERRIPRLFFLVGTCGASVLAGMAPCSPVHAEPDLFLSTDIGFSRNATIIRGDWIVQVGPVYPLGGKWFVAPGGRFGGRASTELDCEQCETLERILVGNDIKLGLAPSGLGDRDRHRRHAYLSVGTEA